MKGNYLVSTKASTGENLQFLSNVGLVQTGRFLWSICWAITAVNWPAVLRNIPYALDSIAFIGLSVADSVVAFQRGHLSVFLITQLSGQSTWAFESTYVRWKWGRKWHFTVYNGTGVMWCSEWRCHCHYTRHRKYPCSFNNFAQDNTLVALITL